MKSAKGKLLIKIFWSTLYTMLCSTIHKSGLCIAALRMFSTLLIPLWPIFWSFRPLSCLIIRPSHEYIDHVLVLTPFSQKMKVYKHPQIQFSKVMLIYFLLYCFLLSTYLSIYTFITSKVYCFDTRLTTRSCSNIIRKPPNKTRPKNKVVKKSLSSYTRTINFPFMYYLLVILYCMPRSLFFYLLSLC